MSRKCLGSASRRELDDDWRVRLARRLEASVDGRGRDAVDRRDGVPILLCVLQQVDERLSCMRGAPLSSHSLLSISYSAPPGKRLARHDARVDRGREVGIRRHRALVHAGQAKVVRKPKERVRDRFRRKPSSRLLRQPRRAGTLLRGAGQASAASRGAERTRGC